MSGNASEPDGAAEGRREAPSGTPLEIVISLAVAGLSWLATPGAGVVMHWGSDGAPGWSMGAAGYALVGGIVTFCIGRLITALVAWKIGFAHSPAATLGFGVYWVAYALLQRIWPDIMPFLGAVALGLASYGLLLWRAVRRA